MLHRVYEGVDARHRCRVTRDRWRKMIVRTTNKLKHRTFRQLKLKKMKKTRGHISASSLPSNVKEATANMLCKLCLIRQSELSAYTNSSSNLRKHVLVSTVFVPFH